jgi:hypothetical protein
MKLIGLYNERNLQSASQQDLETCAATIWTKAFQCGWVFKAKKKENGAPYRLAKRKELTTTKRLPELETSHPSSHPQYVLEPLVVFKIAEN